jgi:hypothetical protein
VRAHPGPKKHFLYRQLPRVKSPLQAGRFEKASSSKLLIEFRLLCLDNPSSHAHLHDEHTLVDSF